MDSAEVDSNRVGPEVEFWFGRRAGRAMARVADHLSVADLERHFRSCPGPVRARRLQVIWLLAQGHTVWATSQVTSLGSRWVEPLLERYNASGPGALGDGHRHNGAKPRLLTPEVLKVVRLRLAEPPSDGGLWSSCKVAAVIAVHLGLERVLPQRGWEALKALGWKGGCSGKSRSRPGGGRCGARVGSPAARCHRLRESAFSLRTSAL